MDGKIQFNFLNDVKCLLYGLCETLATFREIVSRQERKGFAEDGKVGVLLCGLCETLATFAGNFATPSPL